MFAAFLITVQEWMESWNGKNGKIDQWWKIWIISEINIAVVYRMNNYVKKNDEKIID